MEGTDKRAAGSQGEKHVKRWDMTTSPAREGKRKKGEGVEGRERERELVWEGGGYTGTPEPSDMTQMQCATVQRANGRVGRREKEEEGDGQGSA